MSTPAHISQADRFVRTRARLTRLLIGWAHHLSPYDARWAEDLYIKADMISHPFAPGTDHCDWYLDQIDLFLEHARNQIRKDLEPYQDYAKQDKRRQLVHAR